jgi:hypothetical protein
MSPLATPPAGGGRKLLHASTTPLCVTRVTATAVAAPGSTNLTRISVGIVVVTPWRNARGRRTGGMWGWACVDGRASAALLLLLTSVPWR